MGAEAWIRRLRPAASFRLTIALLAAAMALVFIGTIDQLNIGIHQAQEKYFRTFFVFFPIPGAGVSLPLLPGGYLLGSLFLVNLGAAFAARFRVHWSKTGIWMLHAGLLLFLAAEVVSAWWGTEGIVRLDEGDSRNYFEDLLQTELAVVEPGRSGGVDRVHAAPLKMLRSGSAIPFPDLSLEVRVKEIFPNSRLHRLNGGNGAELAPAADSGIGRGLAVERMRPSRRSDERNLVSAVVEVRESGRSLGTWLLSNGLTYPQTLRLGDRELLIAIRNQRHYRPYSLALLEFRHERHPGTDTPRHFSSRLRLTYPERREDRPVLISMNQPFRYRGDIVYQSGFDNEDRTSILRVVRNPGWPLPYVATAVTGAGLLVQFGISLFRFLGRKGQRPSERNALAGRDLAIRPGRLALPSLLLTCGSLLVVGWSLRSGPPIHHPDTGDFGALPVQAHGRIQPMDAVARGALLHLQGRTRVEDGEGRRLEPARWLLDVLFRPEVADGYPVFRIQNPEVLELVQPGLEAPAVLAYEQLAPLLGDIIRQAMEAERLEADERSIFQREVLLLARGLHLYQGLQESFPTGGPGNLAAETERFEELLPPGLEAVRRRALGEEFDSTMERKMVAFSFRYLRMEEEGVLRPFPPAGGGSDGAAWRNAGSVLVERITGGEISGLFRGYAALEEAWRSQDAAGFAAAVARIRAELAGPNGPALRRASHEAFFLRADLFNRTAFLYGIGLLFVLGSWILWPRTMREAGFWILLVAFAIHTIGLLIRIYLHGRPPVTNLYASAVFVGWGTVLLGLVVERIFRDGLAAAGAAIVGVTTLIIAHQLSLAGDTLETVRAVLDSNFWLATHVIVITIGYSAMFLAGGMAAVGLLRSLRRSGSRGKGEGPASTVYGVLCFAMLFSLVGTVLGGIWADQSWGRFWGWDPKENGALLIVIWNVIILHARLGGLIRETGLLVMAVFGNIVTAFAWFGVNMLGVGLHSYGFMEGGWRWLILFALANVAIMTTPFFQRKPEGRPEAELP